MVEIGGQPILWHIMKHLRPPRATTTSSIALGYKGELIKRYMVDYASLHSDLTVDMRNGNVTRATARREPTTGLSI